MLVPFDFSNEDIGFVDVDRFVMEYYYDMMEDSDGELHSGMIKELNRLISLEPDFLDPYLDLSYIYTQDGELDKSNDLIEIAYKRAINIITRRTGEWPDKLLWGVLRNRHIIRSLYAKSELLWKSNKPSRALIILRKLFKSNPNDNIGTRYYILAILMKTTYLNYLKRFEVDEDSHIYLEKWFKRNMNKFPNDFMWWQQWKAEMEET